MSEEVEEVAAPVYAWRAYRVEQFTKEYESHWALTPFYHRGRTVNGSHVHPSKPSLFTVDLLEWNEAEAPAIEQKSLFDMPGFHCFHGYGQAVRYAEESRSGSYYIDDIVVARVELGGVVVEHELGYRAQRVRIIDLEHPEADEEKRAMLAVALGWPFEIEYCDLLDAEQKVLIDREQFEIALTQVMHLAQAIHLPIDEVIARVKEMVEEASRNYYSHDAHSLAGNSYHMQAPSSPPPVPHNTNLRDLGIGNPKADYVYKDGGIIASKDFFPDFKTNF